MSKSPQLPSVCLLNYRQIDHTIIQAYRRICFIFIFPAFVDKLNHWRTCEHRQKRLDSRQPRRKMVKSTIPHEQCWLVLVCHTLAFSRWARRWIDHLSLWCMASATPDLRLPSQPQDIAALRRYQIILCVCEQLAQGSYIPSSVRATSRTCDLSSRNY